MSKATAQVKETRRQQEYNGSQWHMLDCESGKSSHKPNYARKVFTPHKYKVRISDTCKAVQRGASISMRTSLLRYFINTHMAANPKSRLICSSSLSSSPPSTMPFLHLRTLTRLLSCPRRWKSFSTSRPIHQRHIGAPSTLTLPFCPVSYLVHPCSRIPRPPTRNRLPVHRPSTFWFCLQSICLPQGTRLYRLRHLQ